jgi:AcrR family transcriptional regulator
MLAPSRERILNAAFSAFTEKGYARTSTLEIATRAKVSKRELYALCADKSALLRDAVTERAKRMRLALELPAAKDGGALATTLTAFGTAIMRGVCEAGSGRLSARNRGNPATQPRSHGCSTLRERQTARRLIIIRCDVRQPPNEGGNATSFACSGYQSRSAQRLVQHDLSSAP